MHFSRKDLGVDFSRTDQSKHFCVLKIFPIEKRSTTMDRTLIQKKMFSVIKPVCSSWWMADVLIRIWIFSSYMIFFIWYSGETHRSSSSRGTPCWFCVSETSSTLLRYSGVRRNNDPYWEKEAFVPFVILSISAWQDGSPLRLIGLIVHSNRFPTLIFVPSTPIIRMWPFDRCGSVIIGGKLPSNCRQVTFMGANVAP